MLGPNKVPRFALPEKNVVAEMLAAITEEVALSELKVTSLFVANPRRVLILEVFPVEISNPVEDISAVPFHR